MNFTRDPVVETVITPKEGCKLVVRSSKGNDGEDYYVDAVEVVSFGNFLFFRSLERPKSFLLPVSDYEILELKETRMVLKTASSEKSIKIGTSKKDENHEESEKPADKRKRRSRKRKMDHKRKIEKEAIPTEVIEGEQPVSEAKEVSEEVKPSSFTRIFPPPSTLIKEKLSKAKEAEVPSEDIFAKDVEEPKLEKEDKELSQVAIESSEITTKENNNSEEENNTTE